MTTRRRVGSTLQQLDGDDWGDPPADSTYLIRTCHRLRRVPLERFDSEDLRIMIGQRLSLTILVPIALQQLERDPLAGGDMSEGALLAAVLSARADAHLDPSQTNRLKAIVDRLDDADLEFVDQRLPALIADFRTS